MILKIKILFVLTVLITLLIGCGGSKNSQKEIEIVWPTPPDEPRVKYVRTYSSEDDFMSQFGLTAKFLAGKTAGIRLQNPFSVCTDGQGRIYVTDVAQGILVFDENQKEVYPLGEKSSVSLSTSRGIAYGDNKVFVGLIELGQVVVLTPDGRTLSTIGKSGQFPNPVGVAYDNAKHRVIVVDNKKHQVFVYSESGDSLFTIGKRGDGAGEFNFPQSAATDTAGNIYIVDAFNFRVEIFDSTGKFIRMFGKQGNVFGTFERPKGIALDSYGNIYVVDAMHQNFQIFNELGELLMFVGKLSDDNRGFQNPVGICIDKKNTIYVTDQLNHRVQVFQLVKGD